MNAKGLLGVVLFALAAGCQPLSTTPAASKPAAKPAGPSKVIGGVKESDLAKVELTEDAEKRLGIIPGGLVAVEKKPVAKAVSYPGEVMIPSGSSDQCHIAVRGHAQGTAGCPGAAAGCDCDPGANDLPHRAEPLSR